MSDTVETVMVNGRPFELRIRGTRDDAGHGHWVAWIKVVGKEHQPAGSWSVGPCLSEAQLRDRAEQSMRKYKN